MHEITLQQAIDLTTRFRDQKKSGGKMDIPQCETFDRSIFDEILTQPGCMKIRIYSGVNPQMSYRAVIVGVNDQDQDILPPSTGTTLSATTNSGKLGEDGLVCPPYCPPTSPLNP